MKDPEMVECPLCGDEHEVLIEAGTKIIACPLVAAEEVWLMDGNEVSKLNLDLTEIEELQLQLLDPSDPIDPTLH